MLLVAILQPQHSYVWQFGCALDHPLRHIGGLRCTPPPHSGSRLVNLNHGDTYINGPFDFAIVNGRKSRDRIGQEAWDALVARQSMFSNPLPRFDLPTYSIHVDHGTYTVYPNLITAPSGDELFQSLHP